MDEKKVFGENYRYFLTRVRKAERILAELKRFTNIDTQKKLKVLAVGGEYGFIEYNLAKWTKWDIITSDMEEYLISRYPELKDYVRMQVLDATKLPFKDNTFDLIIFNHVIEHIPEYQKAVDELHRVLKKEGIMYLATPNLYRLLLRPGLLLKSKKDLADEERIANHLGFSAEELERILKEFQYQNISKHHMVQNLGMLGHVAKLLPESFFTKRAQTNVFIARK